MTPEDQNNLNEILDKRDKQKRDYNNDMIGFGMIGFLAGVIATVVMLL